MLNLPGGDAQSGAEYSYNIKIFSTCIKKHNFKVQKESVYAEYKTRLNQNKIYVHCSAAYIGVILTKEDN